MGVVAACGAPLAAPPSVATVLVPDPEAGADAPPARATAPAADERRPVPARVADLHRTLFEPSEEPVPGGGVECVITVHDGRLSHDKFYAVVLFAGGSVATWTESPTGRLDPFLARLTPEDDARARGWLDEVERQRGAAGDRFLPSATILGISTRPGARVETSYFVSTRTPDPLDRLVQLLKDELEATHAP